MLRALSKRRPSKPLGYLLMALLWHGAAPAAVQTLPASALTPNSASLNGAVNPEGNETVVWFEWGGTTNYGQVTSPQALDGGATKLAFSQPLTGLAIQETYQFRAMASNISGVLSGTNQGFTTPVFMEVESGLPAYEYGSVAWGDFDNDGRLDLLLTGAGGQQAHVWRNTGSGFVPFGPNLTQMDGTAVAWGDYNNDGWLDFVLTGYSYERNAEIAEIWENQGSGFVVAEVGVPGVSLGATAWIDFDRDGKSDLLVTGSPTGALVAQLWRNTGSRFIDLNLGLTGLRRSSVACGDYNNDGLPDVLLAGQRDTLALTADVWRNTGAEFTNLSVGLPPLGNCSVAWGDYDNDGRLDILFCGGTTSGPIAQVWRNTGNGFTNSNAGLPGVFFGAAWGDYDNDGLLDILLESYVFKNTGKGFTNINTGLPAPYYTSLAWGDFDNDGRLDIVYSGDYYSGHTHVFRNNTPRTNTPPAAPGNLTVTVNGTVATFSWSAGSDTETPTLGLTYNLRVGTSPGGSDILSPMSGSDGKRRVPQMGNVQMVRSYQLVNLPLNKTIYWSVQSVDTGFVGSSFAPEQNFHLNGFISPVAGPVAGDLNGDGKVNEADLGLLLPAFASNQPPVIGDFQRSDSTGFKFILAPLAELGFTVRVSTNLTDWETLGPAAMRYTFVDTNAPTFPERYYRLRWPRNGQPPR